MKKLLTLALSAILLCNAQASDLFRPVKKVALRAPSVPLVVSDPYFSIWSPYDKLNEGTTKHWTNAKKPLLGVLRVDNEVYRFMWSEGGWGGPNYSVAYAISDSPFGPFKRIGKILQQNPEIATGAGHHSVIKGPGKDEWYMGKSYSGRKQNHRIYNQKQRRCPRELQELLCDGIRQIV